MRDLKYKKLHLSEVNKTIRFLSKYYKKKIKKSFYLSRYALKHSIIFIVTEKTKIIGHVAFIKYRINFDTNNKFYIFSRHSSLIHPEYRGKGIYKKLCNYGINYLKKNKKNIGFLIWPNKENFLRFYKLKKVNLSKNLVIDKCSRDIKTKISRFKLNDIQKLKNYKSFGLIKKDHKFFKWRYFNIYDLNKYYISIFNKNNLNSCVIFDIYKNELVRILDYFGSKLNYQNHISSIYFKNYPKSYFSLLLKKNDSQPTTKHMIYLYFFNSKFRKKISNKNSMIYLSDTDTFIKYEKFK